MESMSTIEKCYQKIKNIPMLDLTEESITNILNEFYPINIPQVKPLEFQNNRITSFGSQESTLKKQFYQSYHEVPFIPSTDLLKSYQENFSKIHKESSINNITNYKLKSLFNQPVIQKNLNQSERNKHVFDESRGIIGYPGNSLENKCLMIEEKQENILQSLKTKKIEATIPVMENTLLNNEIKSLQKKQIHLENMTSLKDWKSLREKISQSHV